MSESVESMDGVIQTLTNSAENSQGVSVGEVMEAIGHRGYAPFLIAPSLVAISPLGAIPGLPSVMAIMTLLFSGQIALGRKDLWLPDILKRRTMEADKVKKTVAAVRPTVKWLDRYLGQRLSTLTRPPWDRIAAVICLILAACVPPVELIPFAAAIPLGAIALFGLSMLVQDGLAMLVAFAFSGLAFGMVTFLLV